MDDGICGVMVLYEEYTQTASGGTYAHAIILSYVQKHVIVIPLNGRLLVKVAEEIRGDVLFMCEEKKLLECSTCAENRCRPCPEYGKTSRLRGDS